jgi:pimeloyl-ACP methyl ester carboxylesterase
MFFELLLLSACRAIRPALHTRMFRRAALILVAICSAGIAHYAFLGRGDEVSVAELKNADRTGIELPEGLTAYEAANLDQKNPVVVLVGDHLLSAATWENTFRALKSAKLPVLRYDAYGAGLSARPEKEYTTEFLAEQLDALLAKIAPERPVVLAAMSAGAHVAGKYAAMHPDRIEKLVFVGPQGFAAPAGPRFSLMRIPLVGSYFSRLFAAGAVKDFLRRSCNTTPAPQITGAVARAAERPGFAAALRSRLAYATGSQLRQIFLSLAPKKIPTLILWGIHDAHTPYQERAEFAKLFPHAQIAVFENSGALPVIDEPDLANRRLLAFYASERSK